MPSAGCSPARKSAQIISREWPRDLSVPNIRAAVSIACSMTGVWVLYTLKQISSDGSSSLPVSSGWLTGVIGPAALRLCNRIAQVSTRVTSSIVGAGEYQRLGAPLALTRDALGFLPRRSTEPVDDRHKAIDRETVQVCVADAREVGRGDAGTAMGGTDGQAFTVERLDDFGRPGWP